MSVINRVQEAARNIHENNFENAFIQACIAVAATAEKEYPRLKWDNQKFKEFIKSNLRIIGYVAFNINAPEFNLAIDHPKLKSKRDPKTGAVPLEDIIYHAIRCGLLHEGEMNNNIQISQSSNVVFSTDGSKLIIGQNLAAGLLAAVILSPKYAGVKAEAPLLLSRNGIDIRFSDLWGKKEWFINKFNIIP